MKTLLLLPLLASLPLLAAEPAPTPAAEQAGFSAEYQTGLAAIEALREANLAYVRLVASLDNKAEAWWKRHEITAAYREVDAAAWSLHRLRCPADPGEAAELVNALHAVFTLPDKLHEDYVRVVQARGYGQFFWLECPDPNFSRPLGNVFSFEAVADALATASPELREEYARNMAAVELIQQLDGELRALTRENLEERRATLTRLQAELAALPPQAFMHQLDRRDQVSELCRYQVFMLNSSFYSLFSQYELLRADALPRDKRLAPLLQTLAELAAKGDYSLYSAPELKEACYGVPKDRW